MFYAAMSMFSWKSESDRKKSVFLISFITATLCSLLVYWYELSNFTLSIDEEFPDNFEQTVMMGRWAHALLKLWILPEPYVPFFSLMIGLIFLSLSCAVSVTILELSATEAALFSVLYIALPQFAYQAEFSNQVDTVGISTFLSALSLLAFKKSGYRLLSRGAATGVFLLVISTAIYQSSHFITYTLVCAICAASLLHSKDRPLLSMKFAVISVVSLIIYHLSTKAAKAYFGVVDFSYFLYLTSWGKKPVAECLMIIYSSVMSYFKMKSFYGFSVYAITPLTIVSILALSKENISNRLMCAGFVILCILSPMLMIFVMGTEQAPRVMIALPVAFASSILIAYRGNEFKKIFFCIAGVVLAIGVMSSSKLFYSDRMAHEADLAFYEDVISTVRLKEPSFSPYRNKIYFYGPYSVKNDWKVDNSDVFGNSFFYWDGASNRRILAMLKMSNVADFTPLTESEEKKAKSIGKGLKNWPSVDSVGTFDNVVVVRLGDPWF